MVGFLKFVTTVVASLPQEKTNGKSKWGTLDAPTYPDFLRNNPLPDGYPWGRRSAERSNQYKECPDTGVTRYYDWTLERQILAPDGVERSVIVVNGQFPGPLIEANWGDWIEVRVTNNLHYEGTAIHWHGMLMKDTKYMDGVPSVMQCPIAPFTSFTYRFRADLYGSSWWHAHYSGQYAGGVAGPMIIHGPRHAKYDVDLGPVFISDWYHRSYLEVTDDLMSTNITKVINAGTSQNNLINGKMGYDCKRAEGRRRKCKANAGFARFKFQEGKKHLLRLINSGAEGVQRFSIDEHELTVIAVDFIPVKPYKTNIVHLHVAQRIDVVVEAKRRPKSKAYWMRTKIQHKCTPAEGPDAQAIIHYGREPRRDLDFVPTTVAWPDPNPEDCSDEPLEKIVPLFPIKAYTPDKTYTIDISGGLNATGHFLWKMNESSFRANFHEPLLIHASKGKKDWAPNANVYRTGRAKHYRVIVNNPGGAGHPMHFHGHNMFVLHHGPGVWDGKTTYDLRNPPRRDTIVVQPKSHLVIQIEADNPGVWPFHCHIAWHAGGGLLVNFIEREDELKHFRPPMTIEQTCRRWHKWSEKNIVPQIDSGV